MDTAPQSTPAPETEVAEEETATDSTLEELAAELADIADEHGADKASLTLEFPEEHELYGWEVTVTVKAQYEEADDEEEEEGDDEPEAPAADAAK